MTVILIGKSQLCQDSGLNSQRAATKLTPTRVQSTPINIPGSNGTSYFVYVMAWVEICLSASRLQAALSSTAAANNAPSWPMSSAICQDTAHPGSQADLAQISFGSSADWFTKGAGVADSVWMTPPATDSPVSFSFFRFQLSSAFRWVSLSITIWHEVFLERGRSWDKVHGHQRLIPAVWATLT
ncbi:hypothetical protein VTN49DRAFT_3716 [Thermomyces lanuginosus]|uniref:uncharacterized protein n=1 Tax=Thermomyces lanuginosus TaxID=5541 RepID=UPI003742F839